MKRTGLKSSQLNWEGSFPFWQWYAHVTDRVEQRATEGCGAVIFPALLCKNPDSTWRQSHLPVTGWTDICSECNLRACSVNKGHDLTNSWLILQITRARFREAWGWWFHHSRCVRKITSSCSSPKISPRSLMLSSLPLWSLVIRCDSVLKTFQSSQL